MSQAIMMHYDREEPVTVRSAAELDALRDDLGADPPFQQLTLRSRWSPPIRKHILEIMVGDDRLDTHGRHRPGTCRRRPSGRCVSPTVRRADASVPDVAMTEPIDHDLARRGLLPDEHYMDSGYPSADLLVSSLTDFGVWLVTPMLADTSPQARAGQGFDRTGFTIDWDAQTVCCPQGRTSACWTPAVQRGTEVIVVKFAGEVCQTCPVKAKCTTAARGGRQLTLRPRPIQQALDTARAEQVTTGWQRRYARRAGVESTIAQAAKVTDVRRARYRGTVRLAVESLYDAADDDNCPRPASTTTSRPPPSTSSVWMPGATARSLTPAEPLTSHAWNSPSQPERE